ncbi:clarin-3 [Parasteatoda tepidariorum]|uniref:clarin-3 n=1 Tax=Parasteatoda tepidariorum TaxID=114398 RepID=UPI00077FB395|nr:clarin-3 [Parasteatoda tepidariorum]
MRADLTKRVITFCTFFICCGCLALISASLATQKWIVAKPVKVGLPPSISNATAGDHTKFRGDLHFGLFEGSKTLNHGFGDRKTHIWVQQEMGKNPQLFIFSLWLLTIMSLALAMLFALVSAVFAVINTVVTPVEVITGIAGLYLWNGLGALFSAASVLTWVGQYYARLKQNVMTKEEIEQQWKSEDLAWFGFSFWFAVVSCVLFFLNIVLTSLAVRQPWEKRKPKLNMSKNPEGVIMLY